MSHGRSPDSRGKLEAVLACPRIAGLVLGSVCGGACVPQPVQTYPPVAPAAPAATPAPRGPLMPRAVREELPKICRSIDMAWFELAIDAQGSVEELKLVDATSERFGAAASALLRKHDKWSPAVDEAGTHVAAKTPAQLACGACERAFLCGSLQLPSPD